MSSAPGFKQHPQHRVATRPAGRRVQVKYRGEVLADSTEAIALEETHVGKVVAPVVYYFPRQDVRMDRLERTSHGTHCPFKGDASYWSIKGGPANAVWSYEQPYDEMQSIKDCLSFYPDKVEISA